VCGKQQRKNLHLKEEEIMAVDKELVELMKKDANHMKPPDLIEKYIKKGYSQGAVMEAYREVIQLLMADDDIPG
jgi:hypothetical protein